jgi:glucose/arabinose dehydrogenase
LCQKIKFGAIAGQASPTVKSEQSDQHERRQAIVIVSLCIAFRGNMKRSLMAIILSALLLWIAPAGRAAAQRLEGKEAFGDWQRDKPGTIRLIRPRDLPKPGATPSAASVARVVRRPDGAAPLVPPGFKAELFAEGLSGPRIIRLAPNGDIFVAETRAAAFAFSARAKAWPSRPRPRFLRAVFTARSASRSSRRVITRDLSMSPTRAVSCALPTDPAI